MKNTKIAEFLYYPVILLLILFSFFNFSERFTPSLSFYQAIQVMMTPGWSFPGDLYFWGQDFSGSLIPFLSQILCEFYKFPPVLAVSIFHFSILTAGYFAISGLFKSYPVKLLLAIAWFFPPFHFISHLQGVFGIQLSTLFIGFYFLKLYQKEFSVIKKWIWLSLTSLLFILTTWVSDLSIISLILFLLIFLYRSIKKAKEQENLSAFIKHQNIADILIILFWIGAGVLFLVFARSKAVKTEGYYQHIFNNPHEVLSSLSTIIVSFYHVLTFNSGNSIESIFTWLFIAGFMIVVFSDQGFRSFVHFFRTNQWFAFFFLNGIITFLILIFSHWVLLNGVDRRYFSLVYLSLWIAFLIFLDCKTALIRERHVRMFFIIAGFGALSSFWSFYYPRVLPSRISGLNELCSLGDAGIIASSDIAYAAGCLLPDHIRTTPNDKEPWRNFEIVKQTLKQPEIYIARQGWLSEYTDTIIQFGRIFIRKGDTINRAGLVLCPYRLVRFNERFFPGDLKYQGILSEDADAVNHSVVRISRDFDKNRHFIYGPFITLKKGKYKARFCLKSSHDLSTDAIALLDISSNWGKKIVATRSLRPSDFGLKNHFEYFEVPFELSTDVPGMEFRILCNSQNDLVFNFIEVSEP